MSADLAPFTESSTRFETANRELRTPLTDILGMAHLLDDTVLENDQREYVQAIMRASHELLVRVDNNLDLAELSNDALGVEEEFFGITEALLVMVERMRPSAAAKALELSLEFAPDIGTKIHCDKSRLAQAVFNLTNHLIAQYSDGALRMTANIEKDQWGDTLNIVITSNAKLDGLSIDSDDSLDVSRRLVRLMGGDISLKIEEDQSCLGQLNIRVEQPTEADEDETRPARILVAEDSRANQRLIGLILGKLGHEFELVANGEEAVEAARTCHYDLILMDLHMPVMDGMQACQIIRKFNDSTLALVPIIAVTADIRPEMPERVMQAGMDAYLTKPLDVQKLESMIQKFMDTARQKPAQLAKSA